MSAKQKTIGYVVVESCEEYEQWLALDSSDELFPVEGVLTWPTTQVPPVVFETRREARAAIERTHHFVKAFGVEGFPERRDCTVRRVVRA